MRDFVTKSPEYLDYLPEAVSRVLKQVHTERQLAERQLAETKARLGSIIDGAKDAIITADLDQHITLFNRAAETMFRCSAAQALGQPVSRYIARECQGPAQGMAAAGLAGGGFTQLVEYGNRGLRADGTEFPLEASLSRAEVDGKKICTLIVRRHHPAQTGGGGFGGGTHSLADADRRLAGRGVHQGCRGPICRLQPRRTPAGRRAHEVEIAGKTVFDLYPRNLPNNTTQTICRCSRVLPCSTAKSPMSTSPATTWFLTIKVPLRDGKGAIAGLIGISRNITERMWADADLRASEERFRLIAQTIDEVFWMADDEISQMLYISPGYERIWGRSTESLMADPRSFLDAIHAEDKEGRRP